MNTSVNSSSNEALLRRIQRTSSVLRTICTVLLVLTCLFFAIAMVAMLTGHITSMNVPGGTIPMESLTEGGRIAFGIAAVLAVAVMVKALYHLRTLLGNYSRGEIFTIQSARQIRGFGITCLLWGGLKIVTAFLPALFSTAPNRIVHLEFDNLLLGAVILVISWFAEMAAALREETDLTI